MILGYLVLLFPLAALLSFVCYLPYCLLRRRRGIRAPLVRHLVCYALIGVIWSILFVTLLIGGITLQPGYHLLNLTPFVWLRETYTMGFAQMVEQLAMNVAMLIPMGLLLPAACRRMRAWWKTATVIALFMLAVETIQYFIGRSADIDDLIMNTAGGIMGYGLFSLAGRCLSGRRWWRDALGER